MRLLFAAPLLNFLQPILPFRLGLGPPCFRRSRHSRPASGAYLPPLLWRGLCFRGPHFSPTGGSSDPPPLHKGHFLAAPALWNLGRGELAAAGDCFDLPLKRLDLFLDRNHFSQLFNSQVLQWCHNFAQGASPPGVMSRNSASKSAGPSPGSVMRFSFLFPFSLFR